MRVQFKEAIFLAFIATVILATVAAAQAGPFAYITNFTSDTVSVIDTATNSVVDTVTVGDNPYGVAVHPAGTLVYVANSKDGHTNPQPPFTVSVIDTSTNSVIDTVVVGNIPYGVAINPAGTRVYVTNQMDNTISVIDTSTNSVIDTVTVGSFPLGVAVNPTGTLVYVVNDWDNTISVIDTATNSVIDTVTVGYYPRGVAFNPAGTLAYVTNKGDDTVSVIYTATNSVIDTVTVGYGPKGVAVNPAGTLVYVANSGPNTVSVIDTGTNSVIDTVAVDSHPVAFGDFIGPELSDNINVTAPNGGELIPSGSIYTMEWEAPLDAVSFRLKYSMNNGETWKEIRSGITDTSYDWPIPTPPKNMKKCLVKVIGYDDSDVKVGADKSDAPFTIEVLKVAFPNGGETLISDVQYTITWGTNATKNPVETVKLKYTKNGGTTWLPIYTLTGENPGTYDWTVPVVPKTKSKCKVKVVLKDAKGNTVGSDTSDSSFTIEPAP